MIFNNTVTLYNLWTNPETKEKKWTRTVLNNVMWNATIDKAVSSDGKVIRSEVASVTIPKRANYLDYKAYSRLIKEQLENYWTLNAENNLDIMVLGEIEQEITADYPIKQLRNDYSNVVTISSVKDNTLRTNLKHWKVICR